MQAQKLIRHVGEENGTRQSNVTVTAIFDRRSFILSVSQTPPQRPPGSPSAGNAGDRHVGALSTAIQLSGSASAAQPCCRGIYNCAYAPTPPPL